MDDKPLVLVLEDDLQLRGLYASVAERCGVRCKPAWPEGVSDYLADARLIFSNLGNAACLKDARARGYRGGSVVISGGDVSPSQYRDFGVDEVWSRPMQFGSVSDLSILQALMRKYTSDKPRILCVDDDKSYLAALSLFVRKKGFAPVVVENLEDAFAQVPSVRAVISDLRLINKYDESGCDLLDKVREIYDSWQLPFALISGTKPSERVMLRAARAQIVQEKPSRDVGFYSLIDRLVPQHLKPQK